MMNEGSSLSAKMAITITIQRVKQDPHSVESPSFCRVRRSSDLSTPRISRSAMRIWIRVTSQHPSRLLRVTSPPKWTSLTRYSTVDNIQSLGQSSTEQFPSSVSHRYLTNGTPLDKATLLDQSSITCGGKARPEANGHNSFIYFFRTCIFRWFLLLRRSIILFGRKLTKSSAD
jgi:hypothetical protein